MTSFIKWPPSLSATDRDKVNTKSYYKSETDQKSMFVCGDVV